MTTAQADAKDAKDKLALRDAEAEVDALIRAGKVTPATRPHYVQLRQTNPDLFKSLPRACP